MLKSFIDATTQLTSIGVEDGAETVKVPATLPSYVLPRDSLGNFSLKLPFARRRAFDALTVASGKPRRANPLLRLDLLRRGDRVDAAARPAPTRIPISVLWHGLLGRRQHGVTPIALLFRGRDLRHSGQFHVTSLLLMFPAGHRQAAPATLTPTLACSAELAIFAFAVRYIVHIGVNCLHRVLDGVDVQLNAEVHITRMCRPRNERRGSIRPQASGDSGQKDFVEHVLPPSVNVPAYP
jgi:hypothetical protein